MKKILVAGIAAVAFCGAPALAADMPTKGPVYKAAPAPIFNWTGFYVGIEGGYGWSNTRWINTATGIPTDSDFGGHGGIVGGTVGYNWQAPGSNWVLGVEADWSWANLKANTSGGTFACLGTPAGCHTDVQSLGTARGRIGYAWGQTFLYGTGGFAWAKVHSFENALFSNDQTTDGWTAGGGIEAAINSQWSWKLEYLHARFGKSDVFFAGGAPLAFTKLDVDVVRAGLNYRFGDPGWGKSPVVAKY